MLIKEWLGGMLVGFGTTALTQNAAEDIGVAVAKDVAVATQSDSLEKSLLGAAAIVAVGCVVGTKGVAWAVRKVRGI